MSEKEELEILRDKNGDPIESFRIYPYFFTEEWTQYNIQKLNNGWIYRIYCHDFRGRLIVYTGNLEYVKRMRKKHGNGEMAFICQSGHELPIA